MRHRLLVTGSNGRLGRSLQSVVNEEFEDRLGDAVFATRDEIDINDVDRLQAEAERIAPTVIVNCAAFAQVDRCETDRDAAHRVNAEGAAAVARAAEAVGARLIHVSTDLVFDGSIAAEGRSYREDDPVNPLSHYAETKLEGEKAALEGNPDTVVLRSSWFFGPWPKDRFPEAFLLGLARGQSFRMVSDRIGSPTYVRDLARGIARLVEAPYRGVLHFANTGDPTSRYHVLKTLAEQLGIATGRLLPIPDALWDEDEARRPLFSALDPSRYAEITGHRPRPWTETLAEYAGERDA